eukprot:CAMPEP_0179209048 /NCGR_PEP_ID=MMETSP0796-20121207/104257_1 /TAXON_ID=73915 /ORGANISM="Pyrodinium bahamense, Strain pbaha01" /LENGTH=189 /DNA_ID=CAMNT_0020914003 /DNA_START=356 /DNA_END=921 /DNA_ORIENTATION=-
MPGLPAQQTLQFRSLRNNARELVLRVAADQTSALPHLAAATLAEAFAVALAATVVASSSGQSGAGSRLVPPATCRQLLGSVAHARALLRGHREDLFGACFVAGVDLPAVLGSLWGPAEVGVVAWDALVVALRLAGAEVSALDLEEVASALDVSSSGAAVLRGFAEFCARNGALLGDIASGLQAHVHSTR